MDIVETVKNYVEEECKKPTSKYGYEPFPYHFEPVARYAATLADELGADKEIVALAAWLHDIGSILYGREDHHTTGARVAREKLAELGYSPERTERVAQCILNHRGSEHRERTTLEEQIVAEADTMSNFDNIAGIFKAAFVYEKLDQGEAKESVRCKLENKWNQLRFESSKRMIRPKYEAAMVLLR